MKPRTNELRDEEEKPRGLELEIPINWKRERKVDEDYTMESLILAQDER